MKKVGLMTIHSAYNYGAVLQAWATKKKIENIGAECVIIDYNTTVGKNAKKFLSFSSKSGIKKSIRNLIHPILFLKRKKRFDNFFKTHYKLTDKKYDTNNICEIGKEGFDLFITGSDQTFNINLGGNSEERKAYYLPFIKENKFSYAASFGEHMNTFSDKQKSWIADALRSFERISVREQVAADYINEIARLEADIVSDPTLAISREEWEQIAAPTKFDNSDYILFYTVLSAPWVVEYAKKISAQTGLKVIAIHPQNSLEINCGFVRASDYGPAEFISLVKNCKLFLTSSFHGTAFSVIFQKPFVSLVIGEGNRICNLLEKCNLQQRIVRKESKQHPLDLYELNFSDARKYIDEVSIKNKEFLIDCLDRN